MYFVQYYCLYFWCKSIGFCISSSLQPPPDGIRIWMFCFAIDCVMFFVMRTSSFRFLVLCLITNTISLILLLKIPVSRITTLSQRFSLTTIGPTYEALELIWVRVVFYFNLHLCRCLCYNYSKFSFNFNHSVTNNSLSCCRAPSNS